MIFWIAIGWYVLVALITWRVATGAIAWRMYRNQKLAYPCLHGKDVEPTGDLWFGAGAMGIVAALLWPLVIMAAIMWRLPLFVSSEERKGIAERQAARIKELEKELGL